MPPHPEHRPHGVCGGLALSLLDTATVMTCSRAEMRAGIPAFLAHTPPDPEMPSAEAVGSCIFP